VLVAPPSPLPHVGDVEIVGTGQPGSASVGTTTTRLETMARHPKPDADRSVKRMLIDRKPNADQMHIKCRSNAHQMLIECR
jgi:hypothetical protein